MSSKPQPRCTGATYTIHATTSGYGGWNKVDTLPRQLISQHMSFKPQTPRHDVTAIHSGHRDDHIFTGGNEARLLKVVIEIRRGVWTTAQKRTLIERVHGLLVQWKGKRAEKTDIVVQLTEIEDWQCVMRNGRWGMWKGIVPSETSGEVEDGGSVAETETTIVG